MPPPPAWVNQYIGVPFLEHGRTPVGWDCWGCLRWGLDKHFNIQVPAYDGVTWHPAPEHWSNEEKAAFRRKQERELYEFAMSTMMTGWRRVERPYPGCGVHMRPHRQAIHVGLVVAKGWMMHVEEECATVCVEYDGIHWRNRVMGFYEWAG